MQTHSTKPSPKQARVAAQIAYVKGIESLKTSGGLTDADRRFLYSQRPSSIDAEGRIVLEFASPADVIAAGSSPSAVRFFFTHNQPEATEPKERDLYGRAAAKRSNQKKYRRKAASWPPHSDHDFASPDRRLGIRHAPLLPWFIMAAAEDLVRRLHARGFQPGRQADTARDDRSATVDLDTLDQEDSRSVGCERICLQALEELGFQELLRSLGASARDSRLAVALVVAKMINPSSEREALRWLQDDSTTLELLALDGGTGISLSKLYRINDLLWKHRQSLQQGLFLRERLLLDIPDTIVFYDLSNTFYTARPNDTLRRFGRSKQKRNDCPLVSLALLLDGAGFPRSCEILPGNISEPGTLQDAMGRLEAVCEDSSAKPTVIMDAGIATAENLTWLRQQHYNWICVSREGQPQPPEGVAELTLTTSAGQQVQAWKLASKDDEARLYAVSAGKKITANAILKKNRQQFEAALQHLHDGLSKPGFLKNYDRVQQSIGRIMQRYPKVSRQYDVRVTKDATTKGSATRGVGTKASTVTFSRKQLYDDAAAGVGSYVLRTSHSDWNLERILRAYWRLTEIEATFRSLKPELGLRPIWHSKDSRISSHLFITVLACHGVHLIRTRLKAQGINLSWQSIRTRMRSWVRITTTVRQVNGALLVNRQDVRPLAKVTMISRAAGVEPRIHRRKSRVAK